MILSWPFRNMYWIYKSIFLNIKVYNLNRIFLCCIMDTCSIRQITVKHDSLVYQVARQIRFFWKKKKCTHFAVYNDTIIQGKKVRIDMLLYYLHYYFIRIFIPYLLMCFISNNCAWKPTGFFCRDMLLNGF